MNNRIDGLDQNCLIDNIEISGMGNRANLNRNCSNVRKKISGMNNIVKCDGAEANNNNNNNNGYVVNVSVIRVNDRNIQDSNMSELDDLNNEFGRFGYNFNNNGDDNNQNNRNNQNNQNEDEQEEENNQNLSDFDKKKKQLILEMDEYQYKHIQKYDSRKETECCICCNDFIGVDIIKAFYKCEHIFHKKCILDWLKKSNTCPLCNHDLTEDINQMQ